MLKEYRLFNFSQ